ncbi:MAG: tripartite tricarboxylate transporter TctB family protein [Succinivibrio sp.]|nr:tripartite tricarboxylate transporter TctB family protein [Succinivibrio sp.]
MNKSDIGVVIFVYAICLFFGYFLKELPPETQTYPLCLIIALGLLNTLFLLKNVIKAQKAGLINDLPQIFADFIPAQFTFIIGACLLFFVGIYLVGFYISGFFFLCLVLWYLKVPLHQAALTVIFISLVIYGAFTLFLKVPLPLGILLE